MPLKVTPLTLVMIFAASLLSGAETQIFEIPVDQLDRYKALTHTIQAESTEAQLVRLSGKDDLVYNTIPSMVWDRDASDVSIAFFNRWAPLNRYEVLRFPSDAIEDEIRPDLIEAYLREKALKLAEQGFEQIRPPEETTGPARFRILGQRALSFTYAYLKAEQRVLRGENWVELDGVIYIVAIEAPEARFPQFFELVRVAMNPMERLK